MSTEDPKQPEELRQAIVCGSAPVGSAEIAGSVAIIASMLVGAEPAPPDPPKRQPDEDADAHVFHGEADYR